MRRDVFQAIADPTRRAIIHLTASRPLHLNAIAENFDISRPAISQHIKILEECGLIDITPQGRERLCQANLQTLQEVAHWLEPYQKFWTVKPDVLDIHSAKKHKKEKKKGKKNKAKK